MRDARCIASGSWRRGVSTCLHVWECPTHCGRAQRRGSMRSNPKRSCTGPCPYCLPSLSCQHLPRQLVDILNRYNIDDIVVQLSRRPHFILQAAAPRRQTAGTSAFLGQDKSQADRIEAPITEHAAASLLFRMSKAFRPSLSPVRDLGDDVGAPSAFWPVVPLHTGLKTVEPSKHSPLWKVVGRSRKPSAKHSHPHMDIEAG